MKKIIFLDVDGVLNSRDFLKRDPLAFDLDKLDPKAIDRLNHIIDATDAYLVLSSSWRYRWINDFAGMSSFFSNAGVIGKFLGITPTDLDGTHTRGDQIQTWLDKHPAKVDKFIILDDDSDMKHLSFHLIKTSFDDGLLDHHVDQAIALLNGDK